MGIKSIVLVKDRANYDLKKINITNKKVVIVFTDEEIIATFENIKYADMYCYLQNGDHKEDLFFSDEINVLDFNKSLLN